VQRARKATGTDPLPEFLEEVEPMWGAKGEQRVIRWPLAMRVGRVG
jgi:hypothetical protein